MMFNFAKLHFIEINHEDSTVLCFYDKLISENVDTYQYTLIISCMIFNTKSRNRFYLKEYISSFQKLRALVSDLIIFALNLYSNHIWVILHMYLLAYEPCTMSFEWDVKWCPVSRIITPLARKKPFHWISIKNRLIRAASET